MSFWKKTGRDDDATSGGDDLPFGGRLPFTKRGGGPEIPGIGPNLEFDNVEDLMSFIRENRDMLDLEDDGDIDVHGDYLSTLKATGAETYNMVSAMEMNDILPELEFGPGRLMFSPENSSIGMQRTVFFGIGRHRGQTRALTLGLRTDIQVKDVLPEWADIVSEPKLVYASGPMRNDKFHIVGLLRPGVDETKWERRVRGGKLLGNRLVIIDPKAWRDDPTLLDPTELDTDAAGAAYMMNTPGLEDLAVPLPPVEIDPEDRNPGRPGLGPSGGLVHAWNQYPDGPFEPYAGLSHLPEFRGARTEVEGIGTVMAALVFMGHMDGLENMDLNAEEFGEEIFGSGWRSWCVVPATPSDLFLPRGRNLFNNLMHRLPIPFPFLGMINTVTMDN